MYFGGQDCVDNGNDFVRKIETAAIAHPLRIAAIQHQTGLPKRLREARHPALTCIEADHQFTDAMLIAVSDKGECSAAGRVE